MDAFIDMAAAALVLGIGATLLLDGCLGFSTKVLA